MTLSQSQGRGSTLEYIVLSATVMRQVTLFSVGSQFGLAVLGVEPRANEPHPQSVGGQGLLLIVCLFELLF